MADRFDNPSAFANAMAGMTFRLAELHGHAPRTQATLAPRATLAIAIMSGAGVIQGLRMQAIDAATTSSATYNTVGLYRAPAGSTTYTQLGVVRTARGSNGARAQTGFTGATALVSAGDVLVLRRLTKLNTAAQLFASCEVNKNVS